MTQLPTVTGKELVAILQQLGFEVPRIKGSHHFMRHPDGRTTSKTEDYITWRFG